MRDRGIKRLLAVARRNAEREILMTASLGSKYARGLAGESYAGGYRDALDDVLLALNGVTPNRNGWWEEAERKGSDNG